MPPPDPVCSQGLYVVAEHEEGLSGVMTFDPEVFDREAEIDRAATALDLSDVVVPADEAEPPDGTGEVTVKRADWVRLNRAYRSLRAKIISDATASLALVEGLDQG